MTSAVYAAHDKPRTRPDCLLTAKEVARLLKVSVSWLAKARMTGEGPPYMRSAAPFDTASLRASSGSSHASGSRPVSSNHGAASPRRESAKTNPAERSSVRGRGRNNQLSLYYSIHQWERSRTKIRINHAKYMKPVYC